jgi:hypothetical protein
MYRPDLQNISFGKMAKALARKMANKSQLKEHKMNKELQAVELSTITELDPGPGASLSDLIPVDHSSGIAISTVKYPLSAIKTLFGSNGTVGFNVVVGFNSGGAPGSTNITASFNYTKTGSVVFIDIPDIDGVIIAAGGSKLTTSNSMLPMPVPVGLRPSENYTVPIVVQSGGVRTMGLAIFDVFGDITITHSLNEDSFPFNAGVSESLVGTGPSRAQTFSYSQYVAP